MPVYKLLLAEQRRLGRRMLVCKPAHPELVCLCCVVVAFWRRACLNRIDQPCFCMQGPKEAVELTPMPYVQLKQVKHRCACSTSPYLRMIPCDISKCNSSKRSIQALKASVHQRLRRAGWHSLTTDMKQSLLLDYLGAAPGRLMTTSNLLLARLFISPRLTTWHVVACMQAEPNLAYAN